ncbi:MAG: hypothetical protein VYA55_07875 [Pseudomonadota bacterium]|nr:hypothetical protein [Pseudomonadota bacterium]
MGSGTYSNEAYAALRSRQGYATKSRQEIFQARQIDPEMDPRSIHVRESRDSEEHPESLSIIVALDVTGSMGFVPEDLVKNTLPDLMGTLMEAGIAHPQVLFLGIGDHVYDNAPLQVGQFESSADLLDRWLTKVYLEQGGGGNGGESYHLAWLFAARHTAIDCWEKRRQKGFLFTIGDEPCLDTIPADIIQRLTPGTEARTVTAKQILDEAQQCFHVHHMHILHTSYAARPERQGNWRELLGQQFILVDDYRQLATRIANIVIDLHRDSIPQNASASMDVEEML